MQQKSSEDHPMIRQRFSGGQVRVLPCENLYHLFFLSAHEKRGWPGCTQLPAPPFPVEYGVWLNGKIAGIEPSAR